MKIHIEKRNKRVRKLLYSIINNKFPTLVIYFMLRKHNLNWYLFRNNLWGKIVLRCIEKEIVNKYLSRLKAHKRKKSFIIMHTKSKCIYFLPFSTAVSFSWVFKMARRPPLLIHVVLPSNHLWVSSTLL